MKSTTESDKRRVLVVDDEDMNLRLLEALLAPLGHLAILARDGPEALAAARREPIDLVLLDVMMPGMDGFQVAEALKSHEGTRHIPIVMVTSLSDVQHRVRALEAGADDFLTKPVDGAELTARVRSLLKVKDYNDHMRDHQRALEDEVTRRTQELRQAYSALKEASLDSIVRLSRAAEFNDDDTGAHVLRMSHYSAAVARALGEHERLVERLLHAAPMHDVGKIGIPDRILLKPGRLTDEEWVVMRRHCEFGKRILEGSSSETMRMAESIAFSHHERWDGTGYPRGLEGAQIPRIARIVAIADVFDALTTRRPYKAPFSVDRSFSIIREGRGGHFDPEVVDAFFSIESAILRIRSEYRDEEFTKLQDVIGFSRRSPAKRP